MRGIKDDFDSYCCLAHPHNFTESAHIIFLYRVCHMYMYGE